MQMPDFCKLLVGCAHELPLHALDQPSRMPLNTWQAICQTLDNAWSGHRCDSLSLLCSADAPTKTDLNGKVLARLRSTAGTNLLPQNGLARSSSSLSGDLQLAASSSGAVPSIGRLGSLAAGPPQLNKLAPAVGLGAARRSADLPLQQLMGMQTPG